MARRAMATRMPLLPQRARPAQRSRKQKHPPEDAPSLETTSEAAEEGPEEVAAEDEDGGEEGETRAVATKAAPAASENFLARYFKEMAVLSVLKPEEEFDSARKIEAEELELWQHLLSYPHMAGPVFLATEKELEAMPRGVVAFRRNAKAARAQSGSAARRRYAQRTGAMAKALYERDVDRRALFAVMHELTKIARGDRDRAFTDKLPVKVRSKVFQRYMAEMRSKFARAQRSRNEFVKANLRLVVSIARRFNHGRMPLSDLIQEGNMGLIKAVERYDYRRGYRFSTYASWWIRHAISRALADKGRAVRLPVHMIDAYHKVTRTRRELSSKLGRQPTSEEVSVESGIACEKVRKLEGYLMDQAVSLDREVASDDGRKFMDFIEDDAELPSESVMYRSMNDQVMELLRELKPIEADILRKRFGLSDGRERTLKEIGENYNLSRERIRQLQEQALGKIRRALQRQEAF